MIDSALLLIFPALMAFAAASDLFTMTIPNRLTLALVAGFALLAAASGMAPGTILVHLAAGALMLLICFSLFAFGWIGGGDAKLAAATALWLGFGTLVDYLLISTVAGGLLTLVLLAARALPVPAFALGWPWLSRLHDPKSGVPYGIALAGAGLAVYPHSPLWAALAAA